jgi:hypothetical protein
MFKMIKEFFHSMLRPAEYLGSDNVEENDAGDNESILNNIDISVKTALLALVILGLPKSGSDGSQPPGGPKPPKIPVNYEFLAKLYKRVGEESDKKNQNSSNSEKKSSRIVSRRKTGDRLIIGIGSPIVKSPLKESEIALPKVHTEKKSSALVPYEEKLE